jgi:ABC-2 type transport system permease protein
MKIISEDKKTRTDLLLRTLPLKTIDYVLGKYFALITMIFIPTAIIFSYTLILSFYGSVNVIAAISGTLALFLCGCALGALGMFISSLTNNTVISAVFCFGAMLLIYFMPTVILLLPKKPISAVIFFIIIGALSAYAVYKLCKSMEGALVTLFVFALGALAVYAINPTLLEGLLPRLFSSMSVTERFEIFASNAILDLSAIIYFITFAFIFVFLTHQSCEKARLG